MPHHDTEFKNAFLGPIDRIRWNPVIAAVLISLSLLILLVVFAFAANLGPTWGRDARNLPEYGYTAGAIIWAAIAALIAFGAGGFLVARWSSFTDWGRACVHGLLVWALGVPLLLFVLYGLGTGLTPTPRTELGMAVRAGMLTGAEASQQALVFPDRRVYPAASWLFTALIVGLAAAAVGGIAGARTFRDYDQHPETRTVTPPESGYVPPPSTGV